MLIGINPILSPELVKILMEMGHGDEIVISDGNFPGASMAKRLVRADGHGCREIMDCFGLWILILLITWTLHIALRLLCDPGAEYIVSLVKLH